MSWLKSHRRPLSLVTAAGLVSALLLAFPVQQATAGAPCTGNAVVCENQLAGTPESEWEVDGAGDDSIQGFATSISVNVGETEQFKIKTDARAYTIKIYRLGYYQGNGARYITDVPVSATLPQNQPACATDETTEIYDCGTWGVSASWTVPGNAVSGVYLARLYRADKDDASLIPFIVRNDASHSDVVYQTSDPTWQAYNTYGGSSFYTGMGNGRAYKLSYNRPFATRGWEQGRDYLFSNEFPTIRFLEQNGYDVSYISGLDTDIHGSLLTNHKVFLSVGHDEYWSEGQRTNVENARDAGVNLAFLSGNEVYWKTRWEPSEDGSNTANRTLVCYKDTWAGKQIDPLGPTATWRDPRWGGNGKGPENALTGTMYMSNFTDLPITVSAEEGKYRLWRNTSLANQPAGTSTALADHTVGYESDEDLDNGFRPAGLIRLSTTTGPTPQYLLDYGGATSVAPGTTTHHLTMYRAASGALVFSAGTIQWGWGLDADHDGTQQPADQRIRQATVNFLADMGAAASTLASDLVAATKSTDTTAPVAVITAPAANTTIPAGSLVTVTGTATDVGGRVAGVEVSVDGGVSWHPATGTTSFSYTGVLTGSGEQAVQARAIDDSANVQSPVTVVAVDSSCPCSLFGAVVPATPTTDDPTAVTLGVKFTSASDGFVSGIRFYKGDGNTGTHTGTLFDSTGAVLASVTFNNESASGWQTALFSSAVPISANATYVAAYYAPNGHYAADARYFGETSHRSAVLTAPGGPAAQDNGVFAEGVRFPTDSWLSTNYYVDVIWSPTDSTPLTAGSASPLDGSSSVPTTVSPSAVFNRSVVQSSIAMTVADASNVPVDGTISYNATTRKVTFNPTTPLVPSSAYTVRLSASNADVGPMAAPLIWSFTTAKSASAPGVCPCTLFDETAAPTTGPEADDPVELGMAFTSDLSGSITGVRFYKDASNVGNHTVSLWTASGTRLATATVSGETTAGWQQADFATPVDIAKNTTYLVSYRNPTSHYMFTPSGLASPIDRAPLHTPANAGRYTYGSGAPTSSYPSNYFVDPIFVPAGDAPPKVATVDPADNATSVPVSTWVTATFGAPIQTQAASVVVTDPSGNVVPGSIAGETASAAITFVPTSDFAPSTRYTVTVSGVLSAAGTAMTAPFVSHFTTSGADACPCTVLPSSATPQQSDSNDGSAISVGLAFTPSIDGVVTGVRFYADLANTGTHTGSLFGPDGSRLATVSFPAVVTPGWQYATFSTPVPVDAGAGYTVSTYMPNGHYSVSSNFFATPYVNTPLTGTAGLYTYGGDVRPTSTFQNSNYYVDAVFSPSAPTSTLAVTTRTPEDTATDVGVSAAVSGAFSAAIDTNTLQFAIAGPGGTPVAGTASYDPDSRTATFRPTAALTYGATYSVSLAAVAAAGQAMAQPATWTFTTAGPPVPTVSGQSPAAGSTGVGTGSTVSAVFSQPMDASTLAFTLKTSGGATVAGSATYDPSSGRATFTPAAALAASTTYTATLSAGSVLGVSMAAPVSWSFTTAAPVAPPPTVTGQSPASGATGVSLTANVTGTFSAAVTTSSIVFTLKDPSGAVVPASLSYNSSTRTETLNPAASLAYGTTYTASLSATGTNGAAMVAPVTWSFTTIPAPVPTVGSQSPASGATGVSVTTTVRGTFSIAITPTSMVFTVTGPSGAVAGTTSYSSRVATFTPSSPLAYGVIYTASLSGTGTTGGVMAAPATWSFTTVPPQIPTVSSQTPANGATAVASTSVVSGKFSVAIDTSTLSFVVKDGTGATVPGSVNYVSSSRVATFTPNPKLAYSTTYTASLSASSSQGGAMAAPSTWSFTTNEASTTYSMFAANSTPATAAVSTTTSTTVGMRFSSTQAGSVTGVRFYAGPGNTGPQAVYLWNSTGTQLATATSPASTTTGWRTVTFTTPVSISANTNYVVGYNAPAGRYSLTSNDLRSARSSGVLRTAATAGRTRSGAGFPTTATNDNYFVDVLLRVANT